MSNDEIRDDEKLCIEESEDARGGEREGWHLRQFLDYLAYERALSRNTVRAYETDIESFFSWCKEAQTSPLEATHRTFRSYLGHMDAMSYSRKSMNRRLSALRTYYGWLYSNELIDADPTTVVTSPRQPKSLPRRITSNDLERLLAVCKLSSSEGLRDQTMLELMYACGARIGEMANLRVSDVSLEARQVRLLGKGSKERLVPLYPLALKTVKAYVNKARPRLLAGKSTDALFVSTRGNPMSADSLRRAFKNRCIEAGLSASITPHDMRHTFATDLVENGADLRSVQELLGHESLSTTQIYTHLSAAHLVNEHRQAHPRG